MTVQDCIARKLYNMQNSLFDRNVELSGTKVSTIMLDIVTDKYNNTQASIMQHFDIVCMIDFPMGEIPTSMGDTQSNTNSESSNVLHMYDILPITGFFKTSDLKRLNLIIGSVILYKIKNMVGGFQVIPLQIVDTVGKGNTSSAILWQEYTLSPVVDYALTSLPEYLEIVENFKNSDIW
jgi:hypothetical protein